MTNIVEQAYWDHGYVGYNYQLANKNGPIRKYIESIFKNKEHQSVIEIGCFPGRYLGVFGELGYELNGIDITPRIEDGFKDYLISLGFKIGNFTHGEFPHPGLGKYDVVSFIGFIEHFTNFTEIINEHTKLVKDNGYLIIFTPNFAHGFQKWSHTNLDRTNLERHVLDSMNPNLWAKEIKKEGFEILESGYMGGFDFWFDYKVRNPIIKTILYGVHAIKIVLNKILCLFGKNLHNIPNNKNYSQYCFILARKIGK